MNLMGERLAELVVAELMVRQRRWYGAGQGFKAGY